MQKRIDQTVAIIAAERTRGAGSCQMDSPARRPCDVAEPDQRAHDDGRPLLLDEITAVDEDSVVDFLTDIWVTSIDCVNLG